MQYLPTLIKSVESAPQARPEPIEKLLKLWSDKHYFSDEEFSRISDRPKEITTSTITEEVRAPIVKPTMLGATGDPHWLLPVSCMLEVMVRSSIVKLMYRIIPMHTNQLLR
jgi:hypothetical protein